MKTISFIMLFLPLAGCGQQTASVENRFSNVGGRCEGCEAIHETRIPFAQLNETDTITGFSEGSPKLKVTGTVFNRDGKTPAKDVIIYIYHTDTKGNYPTNGNENGWGRRHGYLRGWVKTNEKGEYTFYTIRPASYPNSRNPQHIHITIKEPGMNEYYIDEYHFADDPYFQYVNESDRPRGGSGIIQISTEGEMQVARRNIILGLNIPGYPSSR